MNKKGLLGKIIIAIIIILAIIGFTIYTQLKTEGIKLSSGDLEINFKLNDSKSDSAQDKPSTTITGGTIYPLDEENSSINNTNNNSTDKSLE